MKKNLSVDSPEFVSESNFKSILNIIRIKYPVAFFDFTEYMNEQAVQTSVLENFLKKYGIVLATHLTIPEKIQYEGTYSYKIRIDSSTATKLNRRSRTFHYYGLKSLQSAFEKGVEKGFQIINCLVTNKTLPDRKKNR